VIVASIVGWLNTNRGRFNHISVSVRAVAMLAGIAPGCC
jgi:hypothetical protein